MLKAIGGPRIIGSIVYPAAELVEPGIVRHIEGNRFSLGEPDGSDSERVRAIAGVLREAGLKAPITADIRGNMGEALGEPGFQPCERFDSRHARGHLPLSVDAHACARSHARGAGDRRKAKRW